MFKHKAKGFTLIEMIIAVALLALVMGLGYQIWNHINQSYKEQQQQAEAQGKARNAIELIINKMKRSDVDTKENIYIDPLTPNVLRIKISGSLNEIRYYQDGDKIVSKKFSDYADNTGYESTMYTLVTHVEEFTADKDSNGKITITIKIKDSDKPIKGEYVQRTGIEN